MPIQAKQKLNEGFDYTVQQVAVPHPITGGKTSHFMNIRTDNNAVLGVTSERYGIVNNRDLIDVADHAFEARGIEVERNVYVTEDGKKMRAVYDLKGDDFRASVPQVGDVMGYRLTAQNSFDRSLRVSFALGLVRLVCTNGMTTMEKEVDMVKKHSVQVNVADILGDGALDTALAKLGKATDVYARLASVAIDEEQGLNILANFTKSGVISDKLRENIARIWLNPTHNEDRDRNLYNLNNAVTQHLTHDVADTRFELSNRVTNNVLKRLDLASTNKNRLEKLLKPIKTEEAEVLVTEA